MVKGLLEIILCSKILTMNENEKKEKLNEIVT